MRRLTRLLLVLICCHFLVSPARGEDGLTKAASWQWPDGQQFTGLIVKMLDDQGASDEVRGQVEEYWQSVGEQVKGPELLSRVLMVASMIDPRVNDLRERLESTDVGVVQVGDYPWLSGETPGWVQDAVRLASGRMLAQRKLYDEALETLAGLSVDQVCDPATLLFYRGAAQHHLLQADPCIESLNLLLEREDELPTRYRSLAKLMLADITKLKEDSLDEVGRLMRDVERRLQLGRLGTRVRDQEDLIVKKLDKMIEDIEQKLKQQQQQQQQQQASGQGAQSQSQMKPMDDSQPGSQSGPGDVDDKDIGDRAGWGNLPPAQRQESLQRMSEQLPSHYRDIIEGYFRQIAKEKK